MLGITRWQTQLALKTYLRLLGAVQVYAQVQDALACSDAITLAEQELRGLRYAPSGAAGTGS